MRRVLPSAALLAPVVALLVTVGVAGCGGQHTVVEATVSATPKRPAETRKVVTQHPTLAGVVDALRSVPSFDFTEQGTSSMIPLTGYVGGVMGTVQSPDRLSKSMVIRTGGVITDVHAISVGEARYFKVPFSHGWMTYHGALDHAVIGAIFANPVDTLAEILAQSGRFAGGRGQEDLAGVSVQRFTWSTRVQDGQRRDIRRTINIFIGAEDSLVRKLVISDRWTQASCDPSEPCLAILIEPGSNHYTLEFSFPGKEAPIAAPLIDSDIISSLVGPMALFQNLHVPFSIRYPAGWRPHLRQFSYFFGGDRAMFTDDNYPNAEGFKPSFAIDWRFVDDVSFRERYLFCFEHTEHALSEPTATQCPIAQRIHAHLAAGTFSLEDEANYYEAQNLFWSGASESLQGQPRQSLGRGDDWSAEAVEWTEYFGNFGVGYLYRRQLTHVQEASIDRPECNDRASHCYAITNFTYGGDAEHAQATRALANYSFSTLEWDGVSLGEVGERP